MRGRDEDCRAWQGPGRTGGWGTKLIDFRGARGSNTGDDFHELWATRQAIRLLSNEAGLQAIAVEGLGFRDEAGLPRDTWDGVDCTQYFGGRDATGADHVQIEQLKYSAANPNKSWTIARLVAGRRGQSVIARLAKAWKGLTTPGPGTSPARAVLTRVGERSAMGRRSSRFALGDHGDRAQGGPGAHAGRLGQVADSLTRVAAL